MSERRHFETWWKSTYGTERQRSLKKDPSGEYINLIACWAWAGWKRRANSPAPVAVSEEMVERMARAIDPEAWRIWDFADAWKRDDQVRKRIAMSKDTARAALTAGLSTGDKG